MNNMYIFKEKRKGIFRYLGRGFSGSLEAIKNICNLKTCTAHILSNSKFPLRNGAYLCC